MGRKRKLDDVFMKGLQDAPKKHVLYTRKRDLAVRFICTMRERSEELCKLHGASPGEVREVLAKLEELSDDSVFDY